VAAADVAAAPSSELALAVCRFGGMGATTKPRQTCESPEITVTFDPNVCTHAAKCVRGLPAVFDVRERPWVRLDGAASADVAAQARAARRARCSLG
jgi:uncharacterized Fe-S cluster protein YjdI